MKPSTRKSFKCLLCISQSHLNTYSNLRHKSTKLPKSTCSALYYSGGFLLRALLSTLPLLNTHFLKQQQTKTLRNSYQLPVTRPRASVRRQTPQGHSFGGFKECKMKRGIRSRVFIVSSCRSGGALVNMGHGPLANRGEAGDAERVTEPHS